MTDSKPYTFQNKSKYYVVRGIDVLEREGIIGDLRPALNRKEIPELIWDNDKWVRFADARKHNGFNVQTLFLEKKDAEDFIAKNIDTLMS